MLFLSPTAQPLPATAEPLSGPPLDIIFVGAHPDDVEIACGGTIHRLSQQGYRVGVIDLTDGEPTPHCPSPEIRWSEAQAAAEILQLAYRRILPLPNRRLFDDFETRLALAREFRRWRPRVVVGLGNKTPMASPDHFQAVQITDAAVFYSRLSKWDDFFDGLPVHTIQRQLYYCLSFEPIPLAGLTSQFTVDISSSLETKLRAIACYQTQFPPSKGNILERVQSLAKSIGMAAGFDAGETFSNTRPLGTTDLLKFLDL
jgi:LmbE family N-acetylglucosaminyl deacetylase